jgi:hypothetical protein
MKLTAGNSAAVIELQYQAALICLCDPLRWAIADRRQLIAESR